MPPRETVAFGTKSKVAVPMRIEASVAELFMPQVEQFGITLHEYAGGRVFAGACSNERFDAAVVVYPVDADCAVVSHRISVKQNMPFTEHSVPSLCIGTLCSDSLALCPVEQPPKAHPSRNVAVFGNERADRTSCLRAGTFQNATSFSFLRNRLARLARDVGPQTEGMRVDQALRELVDGPGAVCDGEHARLIDAAATTLSPLFGGRLASERTLRGSMAHALGATLLWRWERSRAEQAAGTRAQRQLVEAAKQHVRFHLGEPLSLDGLARAQLTSRTRLCAAFKQETGESLGAYVRRKRMEMACELLSVAGMPVAQVARAVGYGRLSTFSAAFERWSGLSPSAWRAREGQEE